MVRVERDVISAAELAMLIVLAAPLVRAQEEPSPEGTESPTPVPVMPDVTDSADAPVIEQAGAGSSVPYGAAGVLEVGGAGSVSVDARGASAVLRPYVGWFAFDGIELTLANQLVVFSGDDQVLRLAFTATIEPSVHVPLIDRLWLAIGAAVGILYNGADVGALGIARVGLDVLIGRSGMLHMSVLGTYASANLAGPTASPAEETPWQVGAEIAYAALF